MNTQQLIDLAKYQVLSGASIAVKMPHADDFDEGNAVAAMFLDAKTLRSFWLNDNRTDIHDGD